MSGPATLEIDTGVRDARVRCVSEPDLHGKIDMGQSPRRLGPGLASRTRQDELEDRRAGGIERRGAVAPGPAVQAGGEAGRVEHDGGRLLYTSPSPRDRNKNSLPASA